MNILGISAFYHDSAACLLINGKIVGAAQEERFTRKKHDSGFPKEAVKYCMKSGGININDINYIVFYDKPFLKFERILETYLAYSPIGIKSFLMAIPLWLHKKLWIPDLIKKAINYDGDILFTEHHESHAASAFYPSPYKEAAFLTIDGVGEWATSSYGVGCNNKLNILSEMKFPHSLGLLYSAFTYYTGFRVNSGEYKLMGLAPYGEPKYVQKILDNLIDLKEDGSFRLNMDYFNYCAGLTMTNNKFNKLFGRKPRKRETKLTQMDMDLARSIQYVTESVVLKMVKHIYNVTGQKYLCMAGGVALNCVSNGRILRESPFEDIWIQPAAGDAGCSLGAALTIWYKYLNKERNIITDIQKGSYLGPSYTNEEILTFLKENKIPYEYCEDTISKVTAQYLKNENVIGWFQGRMEFGPRALGNRSIIGDARSPKMQRKMNLKIKYRESFRPFAPAILSECVNEYFQIDRDSPYMLLVAELNDSKKILMNDAQNALFGLEKLNIPRSEIPAITHVDYSARIQTVNKNYNKKFYSLIKEFYTISNCPVIVNTSFNVRGEPIVNTPKDAYKCFMRTEMDILVLGDYILHKTEQPKFNEDLNWKEEFELD